MSTLRILHEALYWPAVALLVASALGLQTQRFSQLSHRVMGIAVLLLTAAVIPRWVQTGHPPIFGTYENSIAATWATGVAAYLMISLSKADAVTRVSRLLSLWMIPLIALGWFFDRTPYPLTISERNILVDIHVLFAWGAHTALLVASTAAILVVSGRTSQDESEWWDALMFRPVGVGYLAFTLMLGIGSLYSYLLFTDWFKWEIVETLAAATWLAYALVIHSAMLFSWRGKRLAYAMLLVLPLMLATFWVWSFYSGTYHHFEIPEIRAS